MSATYLVLNLGSSEALRWAAKLDQGLRKSFPVEQAFRMSLYFMQRNFVGALKMLRLLPHTPRMAFAWTWTVFIT